MSRSKAPAPRSLGDALNELIRNLGFEKRIQEQKAVEHWADVVGDKIAKHTRPVACEGGKLFVEVDSAAWRQELRYMKSVIIDQLNQHTGSYPIHDIILTNRRK